MEEVWEGEEVREEKKEEDVEEKEEEEEAIYKAIITNLDFE